MIYEEEQLMQPLSDETFEAPERDQTQPKQPKTQGQEHAARKQQETKLGYIGDLLYAINRPWLLIMIPVLLSGVWLIQHPEVITNNLDKPYALLAGPVAMLSILAGWLILKFFKTIEAACKQAYQAFLRARKEDGSGQFFWFTILVFMTVSVLESGQFFDTIIHHIVPGLGYATAFVIDLIAVNSMRARLEAVRMRDNRGAWLYLFGVFVCAGMSAFANVYTGLSSFNHQPTGHLPGLMNTIAPWFAMLFPLLILLMSVTADYTVDRTSTKLDAQKYREQEGKRLAILEVRREMQERMLIVEQDLARIAQARKTALSPSRDREFFLKHWLFPRSQRDMQQILAKAVQQLQAVYDPQFQRIEGQMQRLVTANLSLTTDGNSIPNAPVQTSQIEAQHQSNFGTHNGHKSHGFQPNWRHEEALKFMQKRPDLRTQCEAIMRTDPRSGFEHIAEHIRQQPGMNHTFITAQFVAEVWSLLQLTEKANGKTNGRHVTVNDELIDRLTGTQRPDSRTKQEVGSTQSINHYPAADGRGQLVNAGPTLGQLDAEGVGNDSTNMLPLFDSNSETHSTVNMSGNTDGIPVTPTTPRTSRITQKLDPISATDRGRISAAFEAQIGTNTESPTRANQPYTITIGEAARHFQCSESVILNALKRGKLRAPKRGDGKVLISSLEGFVPPRRARVA